MHELISRLILLDNTHLHKLEIVLQNNYASLFLFRTRTLIHIFYKSYVLYLKIQIIFIEILNFYIKLH